MVLTDAQSTFPIVLKGKLTNRSWTQLPEEIIRLVDSQPMGYLRPAVHYNCYLSLEFVRLIATHYLLDISVTNHCPQTWDNKRLWPSRMVYTIIRDALDIERHLMNVCPEWHRASECAFILSQFLWCFCFSNGVGGRYRV